MVASEPRVLQNRLNLIYDLVLRHFQIHVTGIENIRRDRNYIFAMNHLSIMDIPIAFSLLVPRTDQKIVLFLSHIFYILFFPLTYPLGFLKINMNKRNRRRAARMNRAQLLRGSRRLREGENALIFPEGTSYGGMHSIIFPGETGVIRLALRSGRPIIPIGISGSNHAYPFTLSTNNPFLVRKRHPIHIRIGSPVRLERFENLNLRGHSEETRAALRRLTEELMETLSVLSGLPRVRA